MIDRTPGLILPLVNHLMQKSLDRLIPAMPPNMSAADNDLLRMPSLAAQRVMAKARLHSAGNSNWNGAQLTTELRRIQSTMSTCELLNKMKICRPSRTNDTRRLEIQRELKIASREKFPYRSKQRCGPGTNVLLSSDQMRVVTSMVSLPIEITFTDDGRPPRERFETVPAVDITVPFFVCSM